MFVLGCGDLKDVVSTTPAPYYTARLPLSHFLQPELLAQYFLAGKPTPTALSLGTRIDLDDVFALLPHGEGGVCAEPQFMDLHSLSSACM